MALRVKKKPSPTRYWADFLQKETKINYWYSLANWHRRFHSHLLCFNLKKNMVVSLIFHYLNLKEFSTIDKVLNAVIFKITIVVVRGPEVLTFAYSIIKMKVNNNQMRKRDTLKSSSGVYQIWSDKDPYSK